MLKHVDEERNIQSSVWFLLFLCLIEFYTVLPNGGSMQAETGQMTEIQSWVNENCKGIIMDMLPCVGVYCMSPRLILF